MKNKEVKPIKVYVVGHGKHYASWIDNYVLENNMVDADIVLFTGGEDISPSIYLEGRNPKTHCNINRDFHEQAEFNAAVAHRKKIVGICRGAQLACAMSGGILVQHQDNPGYHSMLGIDGTEYEVNSLHHQAMFPYRLPKDEYKVLGWTEGICGKHEDAKGNEISASPFKELEIAYFPMTRSLGIQFHPEMMNDRQKHSKKTLDFCNKLVTDLLNNKL